MPDLREILNALDEADKQLWLENRARIRAAYLTAHQQVLGVTNWHHDDDNFMDLIDIKLAILFDAAGRIAATTDVTD